MERQKQRAEDLQVHFFNFITEHNVPYTVKWPNINLIHTTEDDGRDGDAAGGGAGELLADPVPETARFQTSLRQTGRVRHGPTG